MSLFRGPRPRNGARVPAETKSHRPTRHMIEDEKESSGQDDIPDESTLEVPDYGDTGTVEERKMVLPDHPQPHPDQE